MNKEKKTSFFKKLIISIKDFEKYPELASKKWGEVIAYLAKLLIVFTILVSFASIYEFSKQIESTLNYIKTEIPDFTFSNNKLKIQQEEPIVNENRENILNTVILDTQALNDKLLENYREELQKKDTGIVLLEDRLLIKTQINSEIVEYSYKDITEQYSILSFNKQQLIEYFSSANLMLVYIGIFIITSIYLFILYFISIWTDIILLATFGFFTALFMRLHLRYSAMCKIAIHSLSLPILLNIVTIYIETFTTFTIKYFNIMYIGIAYIYVITAILMIKSDVIKSQQELAKIIEEQEKVREELEKQKEKEEEEKQNKEKEKKKEEQRKKEKKEQKEKDKNVGQEPQGENA